MVFGTITDIQSKIGHHIDIEWCGWIKRAASGIGIRGCAGRFGLIGNGVHLNQHFV